MCGIAGYIVKDGYRRENLREISDRYRKLLRHRGPDSDGEFIDEKGGILLSHTRLSIIDLSDASSQPFYSEDKNLVLIYNGEIYNFREIRDELSKKGYRFNTDGDTEVILRAYEEFGEDAFSRFIGMFAFALLDRRKSLLFLARDMTGIKPLYYFYDEKRLIFSSEMRPFSDFEENIDWRIYFLAFGYLPNPITTKKGVYALRKGHFLKLDLTSFYLSSSNFAKINFETDYNITEIEAINTTRELFKKAVERHLISDAPLGVFLSGGIDSSLISIVASKIREGQLTTLSVQFKEAEYTEERYQNLIAEKIHSNHWAHLFSLQDFMESIEDIKEAMDQPSIDGINTYFVSRMAKEAGCKTVLSGLGGDELFMGYGSFGLIDRLNHIRNIGIPFRGM
ncbi:MAG: asparagine synthase (glutamine-hydrolyzing), partial [Myxococcota bacterium]